MSDVTTRAAGGAIAGLQSLAAGLRRTKAAMPSFGGKPYLTFGKDGLWSIGRELDGLNGETAILNIQTLKAGYVCWTNYPAQDKKKHEKLGEVMRPVSQEPVDPGDLDDFGWDWKPQHSVEGRLTDGDQNEFLYVTSSLGGIEAMDTILSAIIARLDSGEQEYIYPMIRFEASSYDHKQWGKTYKPEIEIVAWTDVDGDVAPEKKAVTSKQTAPASAEEPAVDQEEADEPPVRRRRR